MQIQDIYKNKKLRGNINELCCPIVACDWLALSIQKQKKTANVYMLDLEILQPFLLEIKVSV